MLGFVPPPAEKAHQCSCFPTLADAIGGTYLSRRETLSTEESDGFTFYQSHTGRNRSVRYKLLLTARVSFLSVAAAIFFLRQDSDWRNLSVHAFRHLGKTSPLQLVTSWLLTLSDTLLWEVVFLREESSTHFCSVLKILRHSSCGSYMSATLFYLGKTNNYQVMQFAKVRGKSTACPGRSGFDLSVRACVLARHTQLTSARCGIAAGHTQACVPIKGGPRSIEDVALPPRNLYKYQVKTHRSFL